MTLQKPYRLTQQGVQTLAKSQHMFCMVIKSTHLKLNKVISSAGRLYLRQH